PPLGGKAEAETMTGRLVADGAQQDRRDRLETAAGTQRAADVELVVVQEAEMEATLRGEPHAVAGAAVRLRHRADEADDAARAGEAVVPRLVGRVVRGERRERAEGGLDSRPDLGVRHEPLARQRCAP